MQCTDPLGDHSVERSDVRNIVAHLSDHSQRNPSVNHAADGQSNVQIGDHLGLSPLTVKSHFARIGRRLGGGDRAQLVLLALRANAFR
jgi:DNA-binding NarL/FixJ family response regulator